MKKKAPRVRTFKIVNRVYDYTLFVRIGGTKDEADRWFDKKIESIERLAKSGFAARTTFNTRIRDHMIWFLGTPSPDFIAHEALHSVIHVLTHCGLGPVQDATDEAYAYLLQWTVREIWRRVS